MCSFFWGLPKEGASASRALLKLCGVDADDKEEYYDQPVVYYYPPYYHKYNDPLPKEDWVPVWETKSATGGWDLL